MRRGASSRSVFWFLLKFAAFVTAFLVVWWIIQPAYVRIAGQMAGLIIRFVAGIPLEGMRVEVDETGVLNTRTSLVYIHEGRPALIHVAFLIANIPAYLALVFATPALSWQRRARALLYGSAILVAGHVTFLAVMFIFARDAAADRDIPIAFGTFVMTLPFLLWIVFAYWERAVAWFDDAMGVKKKPEVAPK